MNWEGKAGFNAADDNKWMASSDAAAADPQAGWARTFHNFSFVQVKNAGHMVPVWAAGLKPAPQSSKRKSQVCASWE